MSTEKLPDLCVVCCLWDANESTKDFSNMYTEEWVEKLYRGFKRHSTIPFEFICFTDRNRDFNEPITQEPLEGPLNYGALMEPYRLGRPMVLCGLDTMVVGNVDHLLEYCLTADELALPRDPFFPQTVCNGVALVPKGHVWVYVSYTNARDHIKGYAKDMDFMRSLQTGKVMDDLWPGSVVSYKGHVKDYGLDGVSIVYFHGEQKPHEIGEEFVREEWV